MKVRKFTEKNMPEAMKKVRKELGEDAVILHSKPVTTGGFLGLFTKKNIEVIAAIDEEKKLSKSVKTKQNEGYKEEAPKRDIPKKEEKTLDEKEWQMELQDIKKTVSALGGSASTYPMEIEKIDRLLQDQEVKESIRKEIVNSLLPDWYRAVEPTESFIKEEAKKRMMDLLSHASFGPSFPPKKFINVVGPTGVGKTTTLAKIAAYYQLDKKMTVGFITTDTYRIGAVEQLKTYAKILDIPLEIVYTLEDFKKAKGKFENKDVVLIDSAGRNFQNPQYVEELKHVIHFDEEMETYLVLALTSKYKDMKHIQEQFSLLPVSKYIFTKKDETKTYGSIVNMVAETGVGAAYITNGQNVPDDIEAAVLERIVNWLFEGAAYE